MQADTQVLEKRTATPKRERNIAPGPRYYSPFRALADLRRNPLKFYLDAAK